MYSPYFDLGWLDNSGSFDKLIPLLSKGDYVCVMKNSNWNIFIISALGILLRVAHT